MTAATAARLDAELAHLTRGWQAFHVDTDEAHQRVDQLDAQAKASELLARRRRAQAARGIADAWLHDGDLDWPPHPRRDCT